ncbi:hypothetical protein GCM10009798_27280 [Nocardioides panacihumi]|uniref:Acid phosphatase n=1 Tax=Nocardioides panacihumi TaxID=400774 RepID=A0ABN2R8Y5_9ACTN
MLSDTSTLCRGRWLRLRSLLAALTGAVVLTACSATGSTPDAVPPGRASTSGADERMPAAARGEAAWLADVSRIYDGFDRGRGAEAWLRQRMAHRRPGERLAVVLGIDDVMLQTHFRGVDTLLPRSVRFVQTAHALGYAVFYVTGRSASTGLGRVEDTLQRAGVPANAFYGRPVGAPNVEAAKAQCRAAIKQQGYTLAMVVAASEASFDGSPRPEKEIRLPDFALRG